MLIPQAAEKIAAHKVGMLAAEKVAARRAARATKVGRTITKANRAAALGIGKGLEDLSTAQKARVKGSQFYRKNKKMILGAGALGMAGTAFSNNTGVGSSRGTPNQARGMYGF